MTKTRLILLLTELIGRENGASFLDQSQSKVKQKQRSRGLLSTQNVKLISPLSWIGGSISCDFVIGGFTELQKIRWRGCVIARTIIDKHSAYTGWNIGRVLSRKLSLFSFCTIRSNFNDSDMYSIRRQDMMKHFLRQSSVKRCRSTYVVFFWWEILNATTRINETCYPIR